MEVDMIPTQDWLLYPTLDFVNIKKSTENKRSFPKMEFLKNDLDPIIINIRKVSSFSANEEKLGKIVLLEVKLVILCRANEGTL